MSTQPLAKPDMVEVENLWAYMDRPGGGMNVGGEPCAICGREVNPNTAWWIHVVDGGGMALRNDAQYDDAPADMGFWPLGPECANQVPADYRKRIQAS